MRSRVEDVYVQGGRMWVRLHENLRVCGFRILAVKNSKTRFAAGTVDRIREVVLERGEQERPEFAFEPVNAGKRPVFEQVQEKTLGQVLSVIRRMPAAPSENVERIPIEPAQLG